MALRIVVAAFAALRAVLIYGDATRLATEPLTLPRFARAPRLAPVQRA
jgi:hypothetical protein